MYTQLRAQNYTEIIHNTITEVDTNLGAIFNE
jgi:hypothetical protein